MSVKIKIQNNLIGYNGEEKITSMEDIATTPYQLSEIAKHLFAPKR
jgi:hypothetical protein